MASQLPPSGRPWLLRLASQTGRADPQAEASPQAATAPQQAPRPVGLPIRQASLALGRSSPPPPPPPPVATQPSPLRTSTVATNGSAVVTPRQSPTPPLAMARRSPTPPPPPPSPKVVTPEPEPPKPVPEVQVKRTVDEQQPKNGGNGNSSPAAPPAIDYAAAYQKDEKKYSPASGKGWAMPTSGAATGANNKQGAREMGGITIAGYNIGAFMDLGTFSSSSSSFSHQIRRQQVRSMKNESDSEDATKTEGKTKKPWPSMVNNNVQSVNNSLLFGTRLVQGSPGVHVNLTKNRK